MSGLVGYESSDGEVELGISGDSAVKVRRLDVCRLRQSQTDSSWWFPKGILIDSEFFPNEIDLDFRPRYR